MVTFNATFSGNASFNADMSGNATFGTGFNGATIIHTDNYEDLYNKPMIEGVTLIGNKTFEELGLDDISATDIDRIIFG